MSKKLRTIFSLIQIYLFIFIFGFFQVNLSVGQSNAGGELAGDTTWGAEDSPVTVTETVTVPEGVVLTIDPGVEVEFETGTGLVIEGEIQAAGENAALILFTSASDTPEAGDWNGIVFGNMSNVGSSLSFAIVEYAGAGDNNSAIYYRTGAYGVSLYDVVIHNSSGHGIDVRASDPILDGLTVEHNNGYGIFSDTFSNFELRQSTVSNNETGGVRVPVNASPTITDNIIENNDLGIFNASDAQPEIRDNEILSNRIGIHITEIGSTMPVIRDNSIAGNSEYGVRNETTQGNAVDAERNYWGADSGPYHPGLNPTGTGDYITDYVDFEPWNLEDGDLPVTEITNDINESTTWSSGVYWVQQSIDVDSDAVLTIEPGVIVKFADGNRIRVYGGLNAQGTEEDRIVFTSDKDDSFGGNTNGDLDSSPSPGDWNRLEIRSSGTIISHAILRFGGSSLGQIYVRDASPSLNNLYINRGSNNGIYVGSGSHSISFDALDVRENEDSGLMVNRDYDVTVTNSTFYSNGEYGIHLSSGGTLTELSSNELELNGDGGVLNESASGPQVIQDNLVTNNFGYGMFILNDSEQILFENNTVTGNSGDGIVSSRAQFIGNELSDNRYGIGIKGNLGNIYTDDTGTDSNVIDGNRFDQAISVYSGIKDTLTTLMPEAIDQPVYTAVENLSLSSDDFLKIDPGVILKFEDGTRYRISGELEAIGTEENPVVFTSYRDIEWGGWTHDPDLEDLAEPGDWDELDFRSGASADSRLEHVVLRYGNFRNLRFYESMNEPVRHLVSEYADRDGVELRSGSQVIFEQSRFNDNNRHGLYMWGSNTEALVKDNSQAINNGEYGLYASSSAAGIREVQNSVIEGNGEAGIVVESADISQTFRGNIIRNNSGNGIWNNNSQAVVTEVQFIGNVVENNDRDGIVSSKAMFTGNKFRSNRYPIGLTGKTGNVYVEDVEHVIEDNRYDSAISVYSGISDTLRTDLPQTMDEPVFVAVENLSLSGNDFLKIDPGVIMKFEDGIRYRINGELEAIGTQEDPIVFTSYRDTTYGGWTHDAELEEFAEPGDWDEFDFRSGASSDSRLEHVVVRYGNFRNIRFYESINEPVRHLVSEHADRDGVEMRSGSQVIFEQSRFENNSRHGVYAWGSNTEVSVRDNSMVLNNGEYGLYASSSAAGFREIRNVTVEQNGEGGIIVEEADIPQSFVSNTISENLGHGLYANSHNDDVDTLTVINDNLISDNSNVGIFSSRAFITENTITGNEFALGVMNQLSLEETGNADGIVYEQNSIEDNTYPDAVLLGRNIRGKIGFITPEDFEHHVFVSLDNNISVSSGNTLEVAPGSVFKFDGQRWDIYGQISAIGEPDNKIIFTSWFDDTYGGDTNADSIDTVPEPGDWTGLRLRDNENDNSSLRDVIVRYGNRNLDIRDNDMQIDHLSSSYSRNYGIYVSGGAPTINNAEIHNNPTGVYVVSGGAPFIRQSNIRDNEDYGLRNRSSETVDASNNFWGHETGPFVSDDNDPNLSGEGDEVLMDPGTVIYRDYLTSRSGILLGDVSESGNIAAYDAALILQYLVDEIQLSNTQQQAADVTGSGSISTMDASYILQFVVGSISGFPGMGKAEPADIMAAIDLEIMSDELYRDIMIDLTGEQGVSAAEIALDFDSELIAEVEFLDADMSGDMMSASNVADRRAMQALAGAEAVEDPGRFIHIRLHYDDGVEASDLREISFESFKVNGVDLTEELNSEAAEIGESVTDLPEDFALQANYPNPFNPATTIPFEMPEQAHVSIRIYNLLGQEVQTLVDEVKEAGRYELRWDASSMASGVYIYRMEVRSSSGFTFTDNRKLTLIK